jgi:hypothetical protein
MLSSDRLRLDPSAIDSRLHPFSRAGLFSLHAAHRGRLKAEINRLLTNIAFEFTSNSTQEASGLLFIAA